VSLASRAILAAVAFTAAAAQGAGPVELSPDSERQAALRRFVLQDCGSCHGMRLTGGLGPALTSQALSGRDSDSLAATILGGRRGSAMPPFAPLLSATEVDWIVRELQQGSLHAR
jgi:cytochrome c55X